MIKLKAFIIVTFVLVSIVAAVWKLSFEKHLRSNLEVSPSIITTSRNMNSSCPRYGLPSPDWCDGGMVIAPTKDSNGCYGPPDCKMPINAGE